MTVSVYVKGPGQFPPRVGISMAKAHYQAIDRRQPHNIMRSFGSCKPKHVQITWHTVLGESGLQYKA